MSFLEVKNVSKFYSDESKASLENLSFCIEKGEWICIEKENCEKSDKLYSTTLVNVLSCLEKIDSGEILLWGTNINVKDQKMITEFRRDKIGIISQDSNLVDYLNAVENIMLSQYFHSLTDEIDAMKILEMLGIGHKAKCFPKQLSNFENKLVCLGRALANEPQILVIDEATKNLSAEEQEQFLELLKNFKQEGKTIIYRTTLKKVKNCCDRILVLENGHFIKEIKNNQ